MRRAWVLPLMVVLVAPAGAQQRADDDFRFTISKPAFSRGEGPRVCMDLAHNNFQSSARNPGAYGPFVELLAGDGYRVRETSQDFTATMLSTCDILVITDAMGAEYLSDWAFPHTSAFKRGELEALYAWVRTGGSLLLIVDHAPRPGAAADLGTMLGVVMIDGYAFLKTPSATYSLPDVFSREGGHIRAHSIVQGRDASERVATVGSWVGTAFQASRDWSPLLVFGPDAVADLPTGFNVPDLPRNQWPRLSVAGWFHAGTRRIEKGRVVLLGEVSICTALFGTERRPVGINHPQAASNAQFCLNAMRWLSGMLGD